MTAILQRRTSRIALAAVGTVAALVQRMRLVVTVLVLVGAQPVLADPLALQPPGITDPCRAAALDPPTIYSRRHFNLSTNPLGMMFGYYGASGEVTLSRLFAARLDGDVWDSQSTTSTRLSGYELGASVPFYPSGMYFGPFFEPGIVFRASRVTTQGETHHRAWIGPELLIGLHFMFRSGFNVAIALGLARPLVTQGEVREKQVDGYLRFGIAF
jgi:hypothetical protein